MLKSKPLAAFAACLPIAFAGCGGGGGKAVVTAGYDAFDTLLVTDVFAQNPNGQHSYERSRCSHDQCTIAGVESTVRNLVETFRHAQRGLSNARVVGQVAGSTIEIMEFLEEGRNAETATWGAELDHVSFASEWAEASIDDPRFLRVSYSGVAGQAAGYAPKIAAQYNGAWTIVYDHELDYGAMALLYRITDTGSYINAFFYNGTDIDNEDQLVVFKSVDVNALGKFERNYAQDGAFIEGSFFGGAADEAAGIFEYDAVGGERVLGAFGAEFYRRQ